MAKIEKVISTNDFEQGTIYVDTGGYADSTTGIRSIAIIPIGTFKKFTIDVQDTSGNPLTFSFVGYDSSDIFVSCKDVSLGWKESGTAIDISSYPSIVGIRILINADHDITPSDLGSCEITLSLETEWVIKNSYPYLEHLDEPIDILIEPFPVSLMIQKKGEYPKYQYLKPIDILIEPFPVSLMIQKKGEYPKYQYLKPIDVGAFANATSLRYVRIPKTVKKIGKYAFRNTALTSVTIARDCEYYPTSFPDGCAINFY